MNKLDDLLRGRPTCELTRQNLEALTCEMRLAAENPERLVAFIRTGELSTGALALAAELLGHAPAEIAEPILLELLQHSNALVREGAVYGAYLHRTPAIGAAVQHNARCDVSEGVRDAAQDTLDDWAREALKALFGMTADDCEQLGLDLDATLDEALAMAKTLAGGGR